ncbi:hypothetical protein [Salinicoccus bachuensis]|uniref:Uncharacterized protein n=1 Tax=Salinicoccus bachuensis TaxID=3136731 RepID=A0ABZ3CL46_9STAP
MQTKEVEKMGMKDLIKKIIPKEKDCCSLEIEEKRQDEKMENESGAQETQGNQKIAEK